MYAYLSKNLLIGSGELADFYLNKGILIQFRYATNIIGNIKKRNHGREENIHY